HAPQPSSPASFPSSTGTTASATPPSPTPPSPMPSSTALSTTPTASPSRAKACAKPPPSAKVLTPSPPSNLMSTPIREHRPQGGRVYEKQAEQARKNYGTPKDQPCSRRANVPDQTAERRGIR